MSRAEVVAARELLRRRTASAWLSSRGRPVAPDLEPSVRRQFHEAFALLDADGSGTLSEAEVFMGFRALSLPTSRAAVRHMVAESTKRDHGNEGITYASFERMMAARREELPNGGVRPAAPPVSLEVMARSLRRAKLLDSVLKEREAAIADYRSRAAAAAAAREAAEQAAIEEHPDPDEAAPAEEDNWAPAPPPGLHDDGDEVRHQDDEEQPPVYVIRKQRRRSVLFSAGGLQKLVES